MTDFTDRQRHCTSKSREKSSGHGRAGKIEARELTPQGNLLLLQEIETNRAFILLAYQSDPALLELADPEIRRLFEIEDQQTRAAGCKQSVDAA